MDQHQLINIKLIIKYQGGVINFPKNVIFDSSGELNFKPFIKGNTYIHELISLDKGDTWLCSCSFL